MCIRDSYYIDLPDDEYINVPSLYPDFKLKGRSVASVLRFNEEWISYLKLIKGVGVGNFSSSKFKPFRTYHKKSLVTIKQIMNAKDLIKEGKIMSHCVATYAGECAKGDSSIWSLKIRSSNKKVKNVLTIEILENEKHINEALGKCNRNATKLEHQWLKAWAEKEGLKLCYDGNG